ncbi:uncharacterized protein LOC142238392 [Haematobia irritans]|uniref:uncharacterized protein LOC142238392 n=1 Tax=Haematobia irritans TaxID=7368 RepID=UPI003F507D2B
MSCEQCHVKFTVFKRKRSCSDCKRYFCHNCLVSRKNSQLCERCILFSRRPLERSDLVKLKTKDLIFYLQSKHISTAGCVEKEDLIDLVIQCVERMDSNQSSSSGSSKSSSKNTTPQHQPPSGDQRGAGGASADSGAAGGGGNRRSFDTTNSFDNIKQTCQNFFSHLSDNISDSIANLESRACSKNRTGRCSNNGQSRASNVTEQPRVATREIPTYASMQQTNNNYGVIETPAPVYSVASSPEERDPQQQTIPIQSPTANTIVSTVQLPPEAEQTEVIEGRGHDVQDTAKEILGDCECSDEELIVTFNSRTRSPKIEIEANTSMSNDEADQATNYGPSTSASTSKPSSQYSKLDIYPKDEEESSHSSFEELGAIGGISDDSKTTTDTTSNTTDQWQMLDLKQEANSNQAVDAIDNKTSSTDQPPIQTSPLTQSLRSKKVTRRRSESYLNRRRHQFSIDDEDDDEGSTTLSTSLNNPSSHDRIKEETETPPATSSTSKRCCLRCGKNKANIRHQVEKMRKHLESSQMSESDIKHELSEFLAYLEQRTKSVEYSDSEAGASTPSAGVHTDVSTLQLPENNLTERDTAHNSKTGIDASTTIPEKDSRFINLEEYDSLQQLENLSVKQLKEILMLHRVDYKGCCEKTELLDRVGRLWKNLKSTPAVEKLPTDELCKICMDAPIECVILECGHMATCTNCGKVLSECPICRQYIVRVVRFFRA